MQLFSKKNFGLNLFSFGWSKVKINSYEKVHLFLAAVHFRNSDSCPSRCICESETRRSKSGSGKTQKSRKSICLGEWRLDLAPQKATIYLGRREMAAATESSSVGRWSLEGYIGRMVLGVRPLEKDIRSVLIYILCLIIVIFFYWLIIEI